MGRDIARWTSILRAAACAFLRSDDSLLDAAAGALSPAELRWLRWARQPPMAAMQVEPCNMPGGSGAHTHASSFGRALSADPALGLAHTAVLLGLVYVD